MDGPPEKPKMTTKTKYAMDIIMLNLTDNISHILTAQPTGHAQAGAGWFEYKIERNENEAFKQTRGADGTNVWDSCYLRTPGGSWHSCGNRHGLRRMMAKLSLLILAAYQEDKSPELPTNLFEIEREIYGN